jgi:hypothetical protein
MADASDPRLCVEPIVIDEPINIKGGTLRIYPDLNSLVVAPARCEMGACCWEADASFTTVAGMSRRLRVGGRRVVLATRRTSAIVVGFYTLDRGAEAPLIWARGVSLSHSIAVDKVGSIAAARSPS